MSDLLTWSINLGRWAGIPVKVHFTLVLFVAVKLLGALFGEGPDHAVDLAVTASWLGLLVVALALHELGHAATAQRLGLEPDEVRLWPLGNLATPQPVRVSRSREEMLVAASGPLTSLAIAAVIFLGLLFADARMVLSPFGREGTGDGTPTIAGEAAVTFGPIWWLGWFGFLNWVLFLANLIPALPMDNGRVLRAYMAGPSLTSSRDGMIAPWTARTFAILLGLVGLGRILMGREAGAFELISLAILIEVMVRRESWMMEEGSFYEDSLFGYDFSEGYTSLEGSGPKVRPSRGESALARWRRRRSEARRNRLAAKDAAEARRMDELLAKIHATGRDSLSADEQRFLLRVSAKYKNRSPRPGV